MEFSQLHFARPLWLFGLLAPPALGVLYFFFYHKKQSHQRLERFIDPHLLRYLLVNRMEGKYTLLKPLLLWSLVWCCLTFAIAGPRWSFREFEVYARDQSLVILLDLSQSMGAKDIKPSRLVRARQKIEDIIQSSNDLKIGLVAFAADPHMVTPLTDDVETIRHLLPSLDTDLAYIQGSKLSPALEMASRLLNAEPGKNKAILVITDGGFEDASAITAAGTLAGQGIAVYAMGVGTPEGAPIQDKEGNFIKKNGTLVLSKLEKEKLQQVSKAGKGRYLDSDYLGHDETLLLNALEKKAEGQLQERKTRFWEDRFYLLLIPVLPIVLFWLRRGCFLVLLLFSTIAISPLDAMEEYFMNSEERGKHALEEGDYQKALHTFQDPYRKGVAEYRAGNFAGAEMLFRQSQRPEVARQAAYNLGNALVFQQKLQEAIQAYEDALKQWPDDQKAKDNLEIVKKMLEQNQKDPQNQPQEPNPESNEGPNDQEGERDSPDSSESKEKSESKDSGSDRNEEPNEAKDENRQQSEEENQKEAEATPESDPIEQEPAQPQPKSPEEGDADQWLNQMKNDPKPFLRNKFIIESKRNGTKEAVDPW